MKKLLLSLAVAGMATGLFALDNTLSNEFWCTYGYVNPAPASDDGVFTDGFSSVLKASGPYAPSSEETVYAIGWTLHLSEAIQLFNSFPPTGMALFLR